MNIKDFRAILKMKNASWSVLPELDDSSELDAVIVPFPLGALPIPANKLTARMPRMRYLVTDSIHPWQPMTIARLRLAVNALPASWDWRNVNNQNWITPVRNQGGCGSCVAFAATAAVEAYQRIETNQPNLQIDLSESSLFFVNNRQCNPGDPRYGWWVPNALDGLIDQGICFEENYPYRGNNQTAQLQEGTVRTFKIHGYDSSTQVSQMKRWLVEEGPLIADYSVYDDFFTFFSSGQGVYTYTQGDLAGGHAVLVIGYDDNQACWICKNSWGPRTAHPDGCFRIGYGQCGIDNRMYIPQDIYDVITVDELPYTPENLYILYEGAKGWLLTDGISRMKMFDNKEDARNGLRVARRHRRHGFVGRDNPRSNRIDYITEYWAGHSGLPYESLTKVDCIPYNPNNVIAEDLDAKGWRIKDGNHWMLLAHDLNDALAILRVVERHTKMCFIGRDNQRPNRKNYIMTYWE